MRLWLPALAWCLAVTRGVAEAGGEDARPRVKADKGAEKPRRRGRGARRERSGEGPAKKLRGSKAPGPIAEAGPFPVELGKLAEEKPRRRRGEKPDHKQAAAPVWSENITLGKPLGDPMTEPKLPLAEIPPEVLGHANGPEILDELREQAVNVTQQSTVAEDLVQTARGKAQPVSDAEQEKLRNEALELDVKQAIKAANSESDSLVQGAEELGCIMNRTFALKNQLLLFADMCQDSQEVNMTTLELLMLETLIQHYRNWLDTTDLLHAPDFLRGLDTFTKGTVGSKANESFMEAEPLIQEYSKFLAWGQGLIVNIANSTPFEANKRLGKLQEGFSDNKRQLKQALEIYESGHQLIGPAVAASLNQTSDGMLTTKQLERLGKAFDPIYSQVNTMVFWVERQKDEVDSGIDQVVKTLHKVFVQEDNYTVPREVEKTGMAPVMTGAWGLLQMNSSTKLDMPKKPTGVNFHQGMRENETDRDLIVPYDKNIGDFAVQLFAAANDVQNNTEVWGQNLGNKLRNSALAMDVWAAEMLAYELRNNLDPVADQMSSSLNRTFENKNDLLKFTAESVKDKKVNISELEAIVTNVLKQHQKSWMNSTALLGNSVDEFINNLELAGQGRLAEEANIAAVAASDLASPYNSTLTRATNHLANITERPPSEATRQLYKVTDELQASAGEAKEQLQGVSHAFLNLANNFNSTFNQTVDGMLSDEDGGRLDKAFRGVHDRVSTMVFHAGRANEELAASIDRVVKELSSLLPKEEEVLLPAFG